MAIKSILGTGSNLDIDDTSAPDGSGVVNINVYQDRAGARHTIPPIAVYDTINSGNTYAYDSKDHGVTLAVSGGTVYKQTEKNGTWTEITNCTLDPDAVPTFVEDGTSIFFAANSPIYRILPTGTAALLMGEYVAPPGDDTTLVLGVAFVSVGGISDIRQISMVSDQAKEIRYTINGTTPTAASTLYTRPITTYSDLTLKAVAIDNDDVVSAVTTEIIDYNGWDTVAPFVTFFSVGAVHGNSVDITGFNAFLPSGGGWYCITESSTQPAQDDIKWQSTTPHTYRKRTSAAGTVTLYPWVRNKSGVRQVLPFGFPASVTFSAADLAPEPFSFVTQADVQRGATIKSEAITITGITYETAISVTNGEYALSSNGGATWTNWRDYASLIQPDDAVKVRHTASILQSTNVMTTLTIGGVAGTFTSTTQANQSPRSVTWLGYTRGELLAIGLPAVGDDVPGNILYSDDKDTNYSYWNEYVNEANPDKVSALIFAWEKVYNIGLSTVEVTYFDGVTPFAVDKNATLQMGTPAPNSVVFDGEHIYFLTEVTQSRKIIMIGNGTAPQTISFPIDVPIEQMESIADAKGFILAFRGQNFYCLDFPSANVTIDEQVFQSITLAYHLQKKEWMILGKWNTDSSSFDSFRGVSSCYIERYGLFLIGGRDGKLYQFSDTVNPDYVTEPLLTHRWRDDHSEQWALPRTISLRKAGQYLLPQDETQGGTYRKRQHELSINNLQDAGEVFRALIKTGFVNHKNNLQKRVVRYRYDAKCGSGEFILNNITEEYDQLRR